jgi:glycosyltransferase involved in cell wall biosynthesis
MRILALLTDAFGGHGGIAKFNCDLLTALCAYPSCKEVVAIPRLVVYETEPLPHNLTYVTNGTGNKFKYIFAILKQLIRHNNFRLILCGHINLLPLATLAKWRTGAPIALIIHGIEAWQPTKNWLTNKQTKLVDTIISVSSFTMKRFFSWAKLPNVRKCLLPNSVDLARFTPGHKDKSLLSRYDLNGKTLLMTLGRLVGHERYKGFDEVLEILSELIDEIPNVVYLIAGNGNDSQRLKEKAKKLNLSNHVIFSGYVSEAEKVGHYRLADAFVMPSRGEGFGIVILEAMACGVPVVASEADGSKEATRDGEMGILVDPADKEKLKNAIIEALKRPKGVVPDKLDYFSFQRFEKRCHKIIDTIIEQTK